MAASLSDFKNKANQSEMKEPSCTLTHRLWTVRWIRWIGEKMERRNCVIIQKEVYWIKYKFVSWQEVEKDDMFVNGGNDLGGLFIYPSHTSSFTHRFFMPCSFLFSIFPELPHSFFIFSVTLYHLCPCPDLSALRLNLEDLDKYSYQGNTCLCFLKTILTVCKIKISLQFSL